MLGPQFWLNFFYFGYLSQLAGQMTALSYASNDVYLAATVDTQLTTCGSMMTKQLRLPGISL